VIHRTFRGGIVALLEPMTDGIVSEQKASARTACAVSEVGSGLKLVVRKELRE
jgi:hypothetical protein